MKTNFFRWLLGGPPLNTKTDVVKLELDSVGFHVKSMVQMETGSKASQKPIPLFYIQLLKMLILMFIKL